MEAIGFADLLIAHKYKGDEPAIRTVARAFKQKAQTFRAWRKKDGKTKDQLMQSYRNEIAALSWDEISVMDRLETTGTRYVEEKKRAKQKKKQKG